MEPPYTRMKSGAVAPGCRRLKEAATVAVHNNSTPIPTRLAAGPTASATQPNPAIPAIAEAMAPALKVVKTRPKRGLGVNSCYIAHTTGVNTAVLPPNTMMRAAAMTGACSMPSVHTATAPTARAAEINRRRLWRSP